MAQTEQWAMVVTMGIVTLNKEQYGAETHHLDEINMSLQNLNKALEDGARVVQMCPMTGVENTAMALVVLEREKPQKPLSDEEKRKRYSF